MFAFCATYVGATQRSERDMFLLVQPTKLTPIADHTPSNIPLPVQQMKKKKTDEKLNPGKSGGTPRLQAKGNLTSPYADIISFATFYVLSSSNRLL